jgi:hypothetical protein
MDWILIAVFLIAMIGISLRAGTRIALALALALPVTSMALTALPHTALVSALAGQSLVIFVVTFVVFYVLVFRIISPSMGSGASPLEGILAGLAATIIALVFWLEISGLGALWHFGPQVQALFAPAYRLWWLLGSYIALAFARR